MNFALATFAALAAFAMSLAGCWIITVSPRLRTLGNVAPVKNRWHQQATPGLGGIPVYISFCTITCLAGGLSTDGLTGPSVAILMSALPLLAIGSYDDTKPVRPGLKLLVQVIAAIVFLLFIISPLGIHQFLGKGNPIYLTAAFLLSLIWIVAIINAINLLDNMDGLAAGIAIIACVTLAFLLQRSHQHPQFSLIFVFLAAAIAGFLMLNYNPAKLFMGDAGSLWIGLAVGAGTLIVMGDSGFSMEQDSPFVNPANWLLAAMVCAIPLSDTLMVMITRRLRGQPISVGGRDHLSHRLVAIGFSERMSVAILWVAAILASLLALFIQSYPAAFWMTPVAVYILILFIGIVCLIRLSSSDRIAALQHQKTGST